MKMYTKITNISIVDAVSVLMLFGSREMDRFLRDAIGPGFILMVNNTRPHTVILWRRFSVLEYEGIGRMGWPTRSLDLNRVEIWFPNFYNQSTTWRILIVS